MPSVFPLEVPAQYLFRDGRRIDWQKLGPKDAHYAAWLLLRFRGGAGYAELLATVAAPGGPLSEHQMNSKTASPFSRIMQDILLRAAARDGLSLDRFDGSNQGAYLSVSETAHALGISRAAVSQAIQERRLLAYRLG